jgi:hypothetical protein
MYKAAFCTLVFASILTSTAAGARPKARLRRVSTTAADTAPAKAIDHSTRGIYVRGDTAGRPTFAGLLDRVVAHGMNAVVLDVKDYDGALTYASRVPLAASSGVTKNAPIGSFSGAIHLAHAKGVKVIARISCFHDDAMAKAHPGMAVRGISGHVYRNGWLDPKNELAQEYILALVRESIASGADEIQLDYVRYPVMNIKLMDFGLDTKENPRAKVDVITRFVQRAHAVTRAHGVPLSLDVFGVVSMGRKDDIQNLGQDPAELAKHCEVLSPMVYPSHYDPGFNNWESPGDHPEIVGMGVKGVVAQAGGNAKIRPWLQAMNHKSSTYGPEYIQREIKSGDTAGGHGWLLWNPGQNFEVSWRALPRRF